MNVGRAKITPTLCASNAALKVTERKRVKGKHGVVFAKMTHTKMLHADEKTETKRMV